MSMTLSVKQCFDQP